MKRIATTIATLSLFLLAGCPDNKPPVTPRPVQNPGSADKPSAGGGLKQKEGADPGATKKSP